MLCTFQTSFITEPEMKRSSYIACRYLFKRRLQIVDDSSWDGPIGFIYLKISGHILENLAGMILRGRGFKVVQYGPRGCPTGHDYVSFKNFFSRFGGGGGWAYMWQNTCFIYFFRTHGQSFIKGAKEEQGGYSENLAHLKMLSPKIKTA